MAGDYVIITHTDMDGVGAAALYIYLYNREPREIRFYEPYHLDRLARYIEKTRVGKIVVSDLGMNESVYNRVLEAVRKAVSRNTVIEWYDHHVWDREWIEGFREAGVEIHVDRTTCATGVVAKYAPRNRGGIDECFLEEVVSGVCAGDLWRFDHWRGPWYLRLIRRRDRDEWRLYVIRVLSRGTAWTNEFTENIVSKLENELRGYNRVLEHIVVDTIDSLRIAYTLSSRLVDTSFIAALLMGRTSCDVAVVVSSDGKISFRSRNVDIRELAKALGGGGHPRAAGAKVSIPLSIRFKSIFDKRKILFYVRSLVREAIIGLGGLKKL